MFKNRNPETYRKLCDILVEARHATGLTQKEFADRLGVSQQFVSKYETGERRLDVIELMMICEALQVQFATVLEQLQNAPR